MIKTKEIEDIIPKKIIIYPKNASLKDRFNNNDELRFNSNQEIEILLPKNYEIINKNLFKWVLKPSIKKKVELNIRNKKEKDVKYKEYILDIFLIEDVNNGSLKINCFILENEGEIFIKQRYIYFSPLEYEMEYINNR